MPSKEDGAGRSGNLAYGSASDFDSGAFKGSQSDAELSVLICLASRPAKRCLVFDDVLPKSPAGPPPNWPETCGGRDARAVAQLEFQHELQGHMGGTKDGVPPGSRFGSGPAMAVRVLWGARRADDAARCRRTAGRKTSRALWLRPSVWERGHRYYFILGRIDRTAKRELQRSSVAKGGRGRSRAIGRPVL